MKSLVRLEPENPVGSGIRTPDLPLSRRASLPLGQRGGLATRKQSAVLGIVVRLGSVLWILLSGLALCYGYCCQAWLRVMDIVVRLGSVLWILLSGLAPCYGYCCQAWLHVMDIVVRLGPVFQGILDIVVRLRLAVRYGYYCQAWLCVMVIIVRLGCALWLLLSGLAQCWGYCCQVWLSVLPCGLGIE